MGLSLNTGHDRRRSLRLVDGKDDPYPQNWDSTNAEELLSWTIANGYSSQIYGVELGNEQNTKYSGAQTAHNLKTLSSLIYKLWPKKSGRPKIFGPDPHSFHDPADSKTPELLSWLGDFLDEALRLHVPISGITHHEYIEVEGLPDAETLDKTGGIAGKIRDTVVAHFPVPGVRPWAGEIGPHNGGSPLCDHSSMRWATFADSFWYADALATKAKFTYSGFCRQDFIGVSLCDDAMLYLIVRLFFPFLNSTPK